MTIKQQGGVFGRNPTFNNVNVTGNLSGLSNLSIAGDLVIGTSGNGIDFSATSGTGTSELLDDYEEGTWTPELISYDGTPTVDGYYVKIGEMVYIECSIELDGTADASNFIIVNPPFSMASPYLGGGAVNTNDSGTTDVLFGADTSGRFRIRNSSGATITYNGLGVSAALTLNAQYRAA